MNDGKKSFVESVKELLITIIYALVIAGIIRTLLFQPFWIPSGSMKPNLLIGDYIVVNKFAYGYSKYSCPFSACPFSGRMFSTTPKRGDVVVFRHPQNGKDYVKRLIGLPGDQIVIRSGALWINSKIVEREIVMPFEEVKEKQGPLGSIPRCSNSPVALSAICKKSQIIERVSNDLEYRILDISDNEYGDNTTEFKVPENQFFFLGDNRDNSLDSRFGQSSGGVGFVPQDNLIGRAEAVIFSSAGKMILYFWTWRSDRFFQAIN